MTAPRQVLPGTTYLVTRRCSQREFLLKPSRITNQIFLFLLAVAASRYGIEVHAFCVMSNHVHMVVTDPGGRLPAFHQFLDALVARAVNASLGRSEAFWAPNSYSAVPLPTPRDVVAKAAYVLANPVAARLVPFGRMWPGLWSSPARIGGAALEVRRPNHFFDPKGTLPPEASLVLTVPPGFTSAAEFRDALAAELREREDAAANAGGGFLGVARVLAQKTWQRPTSEEPRRGLRPRVAARDKWKRIEAIGRLSEFLRAYRDAWTAWREGDTNVLFPYGTYQLRVVHGVPCAGFG